MTPSNTTPASPVPEGAQVTACPRSKGGTTAPIAPNSFAALREGDTFAFWGNDYPLCPHCGERCSISDNEWWFVYDDNDRHNVACPHCDGDFQITTRATYTFSTDEQDGFEALAVQS